MYMYPMLHDTDIDMDPKPQGHARSREGNQSTPTGWCASIFLYLFTYLSIYPSIYSSIYLSVYTSIPLSI